MQDLNIEKAVAKILQAKKRLFIFDYDGTLMPFQDDPSSVYPDKELIGLLRNIAANPQNRFIILSGRDRFILQSWLHGLNLVLIAEHGAWMKWSDDSEWVCSANPANCGWKPEVLKILQLLVDRYAGTSIEVKDFSIVWHYRQSVSDSIATAVRELMFALTSFEGNSSIRVVPGNKTVEIRSPEINKGYFISKQIDMNSYEAIIAAGDDVTDEDMFDALPADAVSLKVGTGLSRAEYRVEGPKELRSILAQFIE